MGEFQRGDHGASLLFPTFLSREMEGFLSAALLRAGGRGDRLLDHKAGDGGAGRPCVVSEGPPGRAGGNLLDGWIFTRSQ